MSTKPTVPISHASTLDLPIHTPNSLDKVQPIKAAFDKAQQGPDVSQEQATQPAPVREPTYVPRMRLHPNTPESRRMDVEVESKALNACAAQKGSEAERQKAELEYAQSLKCHRSG